MSTSSSVRQRAVGEKASPPSSSKAGSKSAGSKSSSSSTPSSGAWGPLRDFGGGKDGHLFGVVPDYVDEKLAPGFSPLPRPTAWDWVKSLLSLRLIWASPNLIWSAMAIAIYFVFPYDLSPTGAAAQGPLSWAFYKPRLLLWLAVTHGYAGFFHVTIYFLNWAKRPFLENRDYRVSKVLHNFFWSTSGIAIWTGFENVFAYLWASGKLPYLADTAAFSTPYGWASFLLSILLVPAWREINFYICHRLIHIRPFYGMIHSLHHRNKDIEPFSGLSMHPVEHFYYYACVAPSLIPGLTPFAFLWNGVHLLVSPGASHSGYEDHMQSDAFHYFHHRYYEVSQCHGSEVPLPPFSPPSHPTLAFDPLSLSLIPPLRAVQLRRLRRRVPRRLLRQLRRQLLRQEGGCGPDGEVQG
jgi:sterol desaturase/sphingolipid hydroxylase (fatty acid hydroxylase superfamily)